SPPDPERRQLSAASALVPAAQRQRADLGFPRRQAQDQRRHPADRVRKTRHPRRLEAAEGGSGESEELVSRVESQKPKVESQTLSISTFHFRLSSFDLDCRLFTFNFRL